MWICLLSTTIYIVMGVGYHSAQKIERSGVVAEIQINIFGYFLFHFHKCLLHPNFSPKNCWFWIFLRKSSHLKIFTFFLYFRALCDSILYVYRLVMCKECLIKIDLELIGAWDCLQYIHSNYSAPRNKSRGF